MLMGLALDRGRRFRLSGVGRPIHPVRPDDGDFDGHDGFAPFTRDEQPEQQTDDDDMECQRCGQRQPPLAFRARQRGEEARKHVSQVSRMAS